ncbi:hypothetical protein KKI24_20590 [bacterium]|nr:hypothetical protein [bacterium]
MTHPRYPRFAQLFCIRDSIENAAIIACNSTVSNWMDRVDKETAECAK